MLTDHTNGGQDEFGHDGIRSSTVKWGTIRVGVCSLDIGVQTPDPAGESDLTDDDDSDLNDDGYADLDDQTLDRLDREDHDFEVRSAYEEYDADQELLDDDDL